MARSLAATLLTPRPANVPSSASPNILGAIPLEAATAAPGLALGTASAAGLTGGVAVAAHVCGTDNVPTKLALPITAEAAGPPRFAGAAGSTGPVDPAKNGPIP